MAKDIKVTFEDQTFTLTFNKQSVRQMENAGFNINDIDTKPNTTIEMLFRGAFLARHVGVKESVVNTIWNNMTQKKELLQALMELYRAPSEALLEEPSENDPKKLTWTMEQSTSKTRETLRNSLPIPNYLKESAQDICRWV